MSAPPRSRCPRPGDLGVRIEARSAATAASPDELPPATVLLTAYDRDPSGVRWGHEWHESVVDEHRLRARFSRHTIDLPNLVQELRSAQPERGWDEEGLLNYLSSIPVERRWRWSMGPRRVASSPQASHDNLRARASRHTLRALLRAIGGPEQQAPLRELKVPVGQRMFRVIVAWDEAVGGVVFLHGEEMCEPFDGFAGIRASDRLYHEMKRALVEDRAVL